MVRPLRIEYEGALYHITSRGDRQGVIFDDDIDRELFLSILSDVVERQHWICHAYCLMDNHYHLVIETPMANLSHGMRQLNGVYTQASNRRHQRVGHLFQGRYKSILVDADVYLLELARYVVLNPVRAGMVNDVVAWQWSSYQAMVGLVSPPSYLNMHGLLVLFSTQLDRAQQRYAAFVAEGVDKASVWDDLSQQIYLGGKPFIENAQRHTGLMQDHNIAKEQRMSPARSLSEYAKQYDSRNASIRAAYQSGAYSYADIAEFFHVHFTTVGRIIRSSD